MAAKKPADDEPTKPKVSPKNEKAEPPPEDKIEPIEDQGIGPTDPYPTSGG